MLVWNINRYICTQNDETKIICNNLKSRTETMSDLSDYNMGNGYLVIKYSLEYTWKIA